jgi:ubiquinone/menaquinone biosynthesis C-methylase UbiE
MVKRVHPEAEVVGLDADPQMLKNARAKAAREALAVEFDQGIASELPYPDASFDRVLSSLMIHHLKTPDKEKMAGEIFRVLKPGGEMHVLDFGKPRTFYGKLIARVLHGFEETGDNFAGQLPGIFEGGGLRVQETGDYQTFFGTLTFLQGKKS